MEALRVQPGGISGKAGLLTRADSPVAGASKSRTFDGGTRADRPGTLCTPFPEAAPIPDAAGLREAIAAVNAVATAGPDILALAGYVEAAEFAGQVEDLSRTGEYLQILSAGAVDRTRTQAITAAATARTRSGRTWITGWDNGTEALTETDASWPRGDCCPHHTRRRRLHRPGCSVCCACFVCSGVAGR